MAVTEPEPAQQAQQAQPQQQGQPLPVLIIGAGISGLLLAQYLRKSGVPFRIFERDTDLTTRGVGWGLTLNWSLPALRSLLPEELAQRLPEAYVDRVAVEKKDPSTFPFYNLSTGELKAATPQLDESYRVRVTRERLRRLLATDIDIEWGKAFRDVQTGQDSAIVTFEDGSTCAGRLVVACDGGSSRVRRAMFPEQYQGYRLPVCVMGVKSDFTPEEIAPLRKLDAFFLHAASENDTFAYFSILDAPGNATYATAANHNGGGRFSPDDGSNSAGTDNSTISHNGNNGTANNNNSSSNNGGKYSCQIVVSWPQRAGFLGESAPLQAPATNDGRMRLMKQLARTWAEPFRSLALSVPDDAEIKSLELHDFPPPRGLRGAGRVVLMGDALHAMAMYRGEGANHAIVDVLDFAEIVGPQLLHAGGGDNESALLRAALDRYEDAVVKRARPAVLASRRACLDAHEWGRISEKSPLLSRRTMHLDFEEEGEGEEEK